MSKLGLFLLYVFLMGSCQQNGSHNNNEYPIDKSNNPEQGILIEIGAEQLLTLLKYDKNVFVVDVRKLDKNIQSCKQIVGYQHIEDSLIYKNPELLPEGKSLVLLSKDSENMLRHSLEGDFRK